MHRNAEEPCATRVWWRTPSVLSYTLFAEPETEQQQIICELMDSINTRYGKNTLCFAASKLGKDTWEMSRTRLSPGYTTCWKDLPGIGPLLVETVPF